MLKKLSRYAQWLKWPLAFGLLFALIQLNWDGVSNLSQRKIHWPLLLAAVGVRFGSLCFTFLRWWLLVTGIGLPFRIGDAFRLGLLGEAFNSMGPGSAGGDLVKAGLLVKDHPSHRASAMATVLLDRVLGLWALFFVGALASLIPAASKLSPEMQWAVYLLWIVSITGLMGIMLLLIPRVTHSQVMHWMTTWRGIGQIVRELMTSVALYQGRPQAIAMAASLSLLGHIGFLTTFFLCAVAVHGDQQIPSYVDHLIGIPCPEALSAVIPTPGGLGALEWAIAWFYQQHQQIVDPYSTTELLEVANANGLLTALAYRVSAIPIAILGIAFYFTSHLGHLVLSVGPAGRFNSSRSKGDD